MGEKDYVRERVNVRDRERMKVSMWEIERVRKRTRERE